jgi:hypothetical protein
MESVGGSAISTSFSGVVEVLALFTAADVDAVVKNDIAQLRSY